MTPFRIVVFHPDSSHEGHEPAQVGGIFDDAADANAVISGAARETGPPASLPLEERVKERAEDVIADLVDRGYQTRVEELVPTKMGKDDGGADIAIEHSWEEVV